MTAILTPASPDNHKKSPIDEANHTSNDKDTKKSSDSWSSTSDNSCSFSVMEELHYRHTSHRCSPSVLSTELDTTEDTDKLGSGRKSDMRSDITSLSTENSFSVFGGKDGVGCCFFVLNRHS